MDLQNVEDLRNKQLYLRIVFSSMVLITTSGLLLKQDFLFLTTGNFATQSQFDSKQKCILFIIIFSLFIVFPLFSSIFSSSFLFFCNLFQILLYLFVLQLDILLYNKINYLYYVFFSLFLFPFSLD